LELSCENATVGINGLIRSNTLYATVSAVSQSMQLLFAAAIHYATKTGGSFDCTACCSNNGCFV